MSSNIIIFLKNSILIRVCKNVFNNVESRTVCLPNVFHILFKPLKLVVVVAIHRSGIILFKAYRSIMIDVNRFICETRRRGRKQKESGGFEHNGIMNISTPAISI